jgi:hypothetical protein
MSSDRHARGLAVVALLGATLVAGCGGGSSPSLPSVSRSGSVPSVSRTGSVPSESAPSATDTKTASPGPSQSPTRTSSKPPTQAASASATPTVTATQTVTSTRSASARPTLTRSATPAPSPSATPTTSAIPANESESSDSLWWPWVLLIVVVAGGIGWFVFAAARHRKWDAAFALALQDARSVVDTLVPSLLDRSVSGEVLVERWRGSQRPLDELQTQLTGLAGTAAGAQRSDRIARVSGAAAGLRQALASDVTLRSGIDVTTVAEAELAASRGLVLTRVDALLAAIEDRPDPAGLPATGTGSAPSPPY